MYDCRDGMSHISHVDPVGFHKYLVETGNTICGRHPIAVALFMLTYHKRNSDNDKNKKKSSNGTTTTSNNNNGCHHRVRFTKYEQSSPAKTISDSSVSYASAIITRK